MKLEDKFFLITGAGRRVGRAMALSIAQAGGNLIIHYGHSRAEAEETCREIQDLGRQASVLQADLSDAEQARVLVRQANETGPLWGLVNSAAIFEALTWENTTLAGWQRHLDINLTAPFLLSQAFARDWLERQEDGQVGRIVNILDWRALRPGADHLPYTTSKAALAALTRSMAAALAPHITVNALALGAILPPSTGETPPDLLDTVPAGRWGRVEEVGEALVFLLSGPAYITGEILHIDGGRHLI